MSPISKIQTNKKPKTWHQAINWECLCKPKNIFLMLLYKQESKGNIYVHLYSGLGQW